MSAEHPTPDQEAIEKAALEYFSAYFANNYYGTVVFADPRWHAPKVFRAALWALKQAQKDVEHNGKVILESPESRHV